jgi:hypothetical protein
MFSISAAHCAPSQKPYHLLTASALYRHYAYPALITFHSMISSLRPQSPIVRIMFTPQSKLKLQQLQKQDQQKHSTPTKQDQQKLPTKPKPTTPSPPTSRTPSFNGPAFWEPLLRSWSPIAESRRAEQAQSMAEVERWLNYEDEVDDKGKDGKKGEGFAKKIVWFFGGGGK